MGFWSDYLQCPRFYVANGGERVCKLQISSRTTRIVRRELRQRQVSDLRHFDLRWPAPSAFCSLERQIWFVGSGADFFGGDMSGQPAQPVTGSMGTENHAFVMPDAPQAEQVTVEDAADDEDDDEDDGAEPAAIKQWRAEFAAR